jgi:hypothetical protein
MSTRVRTGRVLSAKAAVTGMTRTPAKDKTRP